MDEYCGWWCIYLPTYLLTSLLTCLLTSLPQPRALEQAHPLRGRLRGVVERGGGGLFVLVREEAAAALDQAVAQAVVLGCEGLLHERGVEVGGWRGGGR